jgi:hypothetical protein
MGQIVGLRFCNAQLRRLDTIEEITVGNQLNLEILFISVVNQLHRIATKSKTMVR